MSHLFEPFAINNLILNNRFILSAAFGPEIPIETFATLAEGHIGLIISGGMRPSEIASFQPIIDKVHVSGGKICLQLVCPFGGTFGLLGEKEAIAVSVLEQSSSFFNPLIPYLPHRAITEEEIETIAKDMGSAALLAKKCGADAIQIHSAHQSFLSQFLSPLTNCRTDPYGGCIENRTRIHKKILQAIRKAIGHSMPILIKVGVVDGCAEGLSFSEGKEIASLLASLGFDALEISQGLQDFSKVFASNDWSATPMRTKTESYYRAFTQEIKQTVSIPVILTGGIRSVIDAEEMLKNHEADLFGLCRPFLREPHLLLRWENRDRRKAQCISCNQCLIDAYMKQMPLQCPFADKSP